MFLETESNGFAPSKSINQQILPEQDLDVKEHLAVFDAFKPIEVLSALHDGKPQLYEVSDAIVPQTQLAVITPIMGKSLNLQTRRIPVRKPGWGEVVDVCFSMGPEPGYPTHEHIAGHEGIGHVVQSYNPSLLGQPVAARYLGANCASCHNCLRGIPESCKDQKNFPKHHSGTFQQYMTVPWTSLMPLPPWVFESRTALNQASFTAALCSGSTALKALRAANVQTNDVLVITGICGGIGHLAGMMAKSVFGARVIGVDWAGKEKLFSSEACRIYDKFVPVVKGSIEENNLGGVSQAELLSACAELRGSSVIESYLSDAVIVTASSSIGLGGFPDYVRDGGSIVFVGVPRGECFVNLPLAILVERQLKIQGTMMGGREEAYQMMKYIRSATIQPIITLVDIEDIEEYMRKFLKDENTGKVVVRVTNLLPVVDNS